jgi:hypothetical protein
MNTEKNLPHRLELLMPPLISENHPSYSIPDFPLECENMLNQLSSACAESITNYIIDIQEKAAVVEQLDKMDLIETCNYIAEQYPSIHTYSMLLNRYFAEASTDIIRHYTFPLLDVFLTAILNKRQLLDRETVPQDWLKFIDDWHIKEMPAIKTN